MVQTRQMLGGRMHALMERMRRDMAGSSNSLTLDGRPNTICGRVD